VKNPRVNTFNNDVGISIKELKVANMVNSIPHALSPQTTTSMDLRSSAVNSVNVCAPFIVSWATKNQMEIRKPRKERHELTGLRPKEVPLAEERHGG